MRGQCAWPRLFEPGPPTRRRPFGGSASPPAPFALLVETSAESTLQLRLFGVWAIAQTQLVLAQIGRAGRSGLGRHRQPYRLEFVQWLDGAGRWRPWEPTADAEATNLPPSPPCPREVNVELLAPLRLQRDGHVLGTADFSPRDFGLAVLRRLQLLIWAHGDAAPSPPPLDALVGLHFSHATLQLQAGSRYSARQRANLPLDGLTGRFTLTGIGLDPLWPWLWVGQWTGAGKGTTQGLGAYRLNIPGVARLP